jgi:DoxX-like family
MGAPLSDLCNSWLAQIFKRQGVEAALAMNYPVVSIVAVNTVSAAVLIVTIVANMGIALADFASAKFVLKNSAEVDVSTKWLPMLGALKAAGAVGLLLGLLGFRPIGIAAALGLVAFFIGAVAAHARARVFYNIAFPMVYLALAIASLVVLL